MPSPDRRRVTLLTLAVALFCLAIVARLVELQIFRSAELRSLARRQHEQTVEIGGDRGSITDAFGRELAVSVATQSLFAHPGRVPDPARAARLLAPVLGLDEAKLRERLRSSAPFVWLKRRLDPDTVSRVRASGLPLGNSEPFGFKTEGKRLYPQASLAAHVVGYANIDQKGVEGIEQAFDRDLQGGFERYLALRDGRGGMVLHLVQPASKTPADVVLSLDLAVQQIAERELERAWLESNAEAASIVLLEPATGRIVALANRPTSDLNRYGAADPEARRDRAVTSVYEPGSTFKVVTASAALDAGTVTTNRPFDCQGGAIVVHGIRIRDHHPYGALTVREIVEKSSNVGIIKVGLTLPARTFHESIERFGFGSATGIELPGERSGMLSPVDRWSAVSQASISMGHEVAVTALQVAAAMAAIANDGVLVPPRIVLGTRDAAGRFSAREAPPARRVVSSETAAAVRSILEGVVLRGTAKEILDEARGYRIAGKTGTAQKVLPGVGYSHDRFVASFAGFGPASSPRLAGVLVIDGPRGARYYGGQVAAPAFGRILAAALAHLRVPPDEDPLDPRSEPTPAVAASRAPDAHPAEGDASGPVVTGPGQIPDVRGLSLREAAAALAERGYRSRLQGRGRVVDQLPPPGTPMAEGSWCSLQLGDPEWLARVEPVDETLEDRRSPRTAARRSRLR